MKFFKMFYCCEDKVIFRKGSDEREIQVEGPIVEIFDYSRLTYSVKSHQIDGQVREYKCPHWVSSVCVKTDTGEMKYYDFEETSFAKKYCNTCIPEFIDKFGGRASDEFIEECNKQLEDLKLKEKEVIVQMYYFITACVALTNRGRLITYGKHSQFLLTRLKKHEIPQIIERNVEVKSIFCSLNVFFLINKYDALYAMGKNKNGTIGLESKQKSFSVFTFIRNGVKKAESKKNSTFILSLEGNLTCHGKFSTIHGKEYSGGEVFATEIVDFQFKSDEILYLTRDGHLMFTREKNPLTQREGNCFFEKNDTILFRPQRMELIKFSIFRNEVRTFLLCLKRLQIGFNILPRFLISEILSIYYR